MCPGKYSVVGLPKILLVSPNINITMAFSGVAENKSFLKKSGNFIKNSPSNSIFKISEGILSNFVRV